MDKKIYKISASALGEYKGCAQRVQLGIGRRLESVGGRHSVDLLFGSAFHKFREVYATEGFMKAMGAGMEVWNKDYLECAPPSKKKEFIKSPYLAGAMSAYHTKYPDRGMIDGFQQCYRSDGTALVEQYFSVPILESDKSIVELTGVIDAIGIIGNTLVIEDTKTTSYTQQEEFFAKYESSHQMMFYYYIISVLSDMYPDSALAQFKRSMNFFSVSIFGVFLTPDRAIFKRSPLINFSEERIREYSSALLYEVSKIQDILDNGEEAKNGYATGACNGIYDVCPFVRYCSLSDNSKEDADRYVVNFFKERPTKKSTI